MKKIWLLRNWLSYDWLWHTNLTRPSLCGGFWMLKHLWMNLKQTRHSLVMPSQAQISNNLSSKIFKWCVVWDLGRIAIGLLNYQAFSPAIEILDEAVKVLQKENEGSFKASKSGGITFSKSSSAVVPVNIDEEMRSEDLLELQYKAIKEVCTRKWVTKLPFPTTFLCLIFGVTLQDINMEQNDLILSDNSRPPIKCNKIQLPQQWITKVLYSPAF